MRVCCALEEDQPALFRFAEAAFEACFTDQRSLDDLDCLADIAGACGLDGGALLAPSRSDETKAKLHGHTQDAIDRGAFGSPMIFVERRFVYLGNDQLPLVRQRIRQSARHAG